MSRNQLVERARFARPALHAGQRAHQPAVTFILSSMRSSRLRRIGIWLRAALLAGVPLGLLIGRVQCVARMLSPTLHFLRMVSPLSAMPLAVMSVDIGDRTIYFLLGFDALWPVLMSTATGVTQMDETPIPS
ncbi:hypothetical protein B7L18_032180 [Burkholderia cenocepacia]|nr:hypothetical protein [Burkholderia cenocepacia]MCG0577978.1 hypothetical protein [Burkholderia cenocepacia]MCW5127439.1 hypothetical protein [Burkholderia cenocepacia]